MRLHYHPLSSYSRKAALGIGLRGDPIELRVIDALAGELRSADYKAMNPFAKMPVLETSDGDAVFESTSIIEYLEARGPRKLIPVAHEQRTRHFDRLGDLYLLDPIGKYFWDKSDEVREKAEKTSATAWGVWEKALADGRAFVCGADVTLGDLSAAVAAHYAETEGLPLPDSIKRYRDRLEALPAFASSRDAAVPYIDATRPRRVKA